MLIQRIIQCIVSVIASAFILFFLGREFFQSSTRDLGAAVFVMFLGGAALSPVLVSWIFSFVIKSMIGRYVLLVGSAAVFSVSAFAYGSPDIDKDALNILVYLFLPMWQVGALVVLSGIILFVEHRNRKHDAA